MNQVRLATLVTILALANLASAQPAGEALYLNQCSICHGQNGEGGRGAPLTRPKLRHAPDDESLVRIIRRGIPGSGMPASPLTVEEARAIAAHVRKLGRVASPVAVAGNAGRGSAIYREKCGGCHANGFGPDLADIGERRSPAHIRESIVNPGAEIAPGYFEVRAGSIRGVRVNEDTFTIQIRDASGKVHSVSKSGITVAKDFKKSPMPAYRDALAAAELDDLVAFLASPSKAPAAPANLVSYERIRDAAAKEPGSWLTYNGDYRSHHYSSLDQINRSNVSKLKPAWMYQVKGRQHFEATPLVFDGMMILTDPPSDVTALDLRTGRPLWHYRRSIPEGVPVCCGQVNRGVAVLGGLVYIGTIDSHLVALDARTGAVQWDVEVADFKLGYTITAAPLAVKDKIVVGIAGAEYGVRGFLDAYDAKTGNRAWRFWTTPAPGEPGNETWSGDSWKYGGATTWVTGSYDPELNLLYWGTGNPGPDYDGRVRKGDNLYSDCVIAVDADTGKLKWHFQFIPHDVNDMDSNQVPVLLDAEYKGRARKLMLFANRNAFYYVLDRTNGEFLLAKQFTKQNWAKRIDERGRPVPNPETEPSVKGALVYPDDDGSANWFNPSYSPRTRLFYQSVREKGALYFRTETKYEPGRLYLGATKRDLPDEEGYGTIRAWDALTGDEKWRFRLQSPPWCGLLATAGDLVFSGSMEGDFFALDATSGKILWRTQTGGEVWANPMSYLFDGRQHIAIAAGNAMIVYRLEDQ